MENLHTDYYDITSYHTDFTRQMTPVSLFCFLQESAWRHAQSKGFGWHDLAQKQQFWIVAKIHAIIHHMPAWTERIRLETWGKQPELLTAFRDFELFDNKNTLLISASSSWHILDMQHHKPVSMEDFVTDFPIIPNRHAIEQKPQKIKLPAIAPVSGDSFAVLPGDIDMNGHVNNTRYIQWATDSIPFSFQQTHFLSEINVNFISEAQIDNQCYINTYQEDTMFYHAILSRKDDRALSLIQSQWRPLK
ncbi:MAG: hypothetical protein LBQ64_06085 [Bacteroidales bacterium]|jgi:acyl-ACP thioesterase|nr:hypothetical protein [Bacteroidales bacterium]